MSRDASSSVFKFQPLDGAADVDGEVFHFSEGNFPKVAALQEDSEVHGHFPELPLFFRLGKIITKCMFIVSDDLEGYEVATWVQQNRLFWM